MYLICLDSVCSMYLVPPLARRPIDAVSKARQRVQHHAEADEHVNMQQTPQPTTSHNMGQGPSRPIPANSPSSSHHDVSSTEPVVPDIKPEDTVIAVMGLTGVGKSTLISHFSDTAVVGDDLESCKEPPS